MNGEVVKAHVATLREWSAIWATHDVPGASEVTFLLERAARLAQKIANGEPPVLEPIEPAQPAAVDEPKDG